MEVERSDRDAESIRVLDDLRKRVSRLAARNERVAIAIVGPAAEAGKGGADRETARRKFDRGVAAVARDERGRRPFNGENELFQTDPHWRDQILFNEYFNGDTGEGLGASHQTGWTSLVAKMIDQLARYTGPTAHPHVAADVEVTARM